MRATSSAGMVSSSWSRQANTTKVAKAPIAPTATIHQMCQIRAKPMTVAKNAQTKPVGQLRALADADNELGDLKGDAAHDQRCAAGGNDQPGTPLRHVIVLHAPGHAEQAKDIQRHEGDVEADQPAPEGRSP